MRLQDLAEGDTKELVNCVLESFGDFIALEPHHFVALLPRPFFAMIPPSWDYSRSSDATSRMTEGIAALMLSLRRRFTVRYQRNSDATQRLARSLHHLTTVEQRELFDFGETGRKEAPPLLLILDRRDDPVTPLLSQWTYQAMLHELLGVHDNRISLRDRHHHRTISSPRQPASGGTSASASIADEVVVSPYQDSFYATNMYSNFGDLGLALKTLVDAVSTENRQNPRDFRSLEDMASFVESLPEMSAQHSATAKHVALMSELSHEVERRALMKVSGVEQDVVCQAPKAGEHYESIVALLHDPAVSAWDKLRLCALFALRYGGTIDGRQQAAALLATVGNSAGVDSVWMNALRAVLKHCRAEKRVMDIFSDRTLSSRIATLAKQHLKGVENVFTQHVPPLVGLLEKVGRGRVSESDYPRVPEGMHGMSAAGDEYGSSGGGGGMYSHGSSIQDGSGLTMPGGTAVRPPKLVVIFIVGGTTYEEAKAVAELNAMGERGEGWSGGMKFLIGGTSVLNSRSFMDDMGELGLQEKYYLSSRV